MRSASHVVIKAAAGAVSKAAAGALVSAVGLGLSLVACSGASPKDCQYGQYWDPNTESCMAGGGGQCPPGMMWNGQTCMQGGGQQCPQGMMWNGQTCVAGGSPQCPQGTMWNGQTCAPGGGGVNCPAGTQWNGQNCAPGGGGQQCPPGTQWNGQQCAPAMMGGGGCQPAGQLDPITQQAIGAGLPAFGQQQAPGASPVGGVISGNFQPGQCVEVQVQLEAGRCYTAVGVGAPGEEVDLQLAAPLPASVPVPPFAQDNTQGNQAVLGQSPNCFRAMLPTPAKFVLKVSAGQGPAAAQLYAK